jgi:hypothetical protein
MQEVSEAVSTIERIPTADGCRLHRAVLVVLLHPHGVPVPAASEVCVHVLVCKYSTCKKIIVKVIFKLAIRVFSTIPLLISSKLAQIFSSFQANSTGQLSSISTFLTFAGCLVRSGRRLFKPFYIAYVCT